MSHPFGDLLSQYLHRKHGLSQFKLANGVLQSPSVISEMCKGKRLSGPQARERVVAILTWLDQQEALSTQEEANALLEAAGMSPLRERETNEAELLHRLSKKSRPSKEKAETESPLTRADGKDSETGPRHNLPFQLTPFFGREREITQVGQRLDEWRLVTLTGSGGVGKTRLALRVAEALLADFQDGVWFVDLAPLSDPAWAPQQLAAALGVGEEANRPILDSLASFLRSRQTLLILDNCEHLLEACARLAEALLRACPGVKILATSRAPLGVAGEAVFRVPSLPFPDPTRPSDLERLEEYTSIRLFIDRARAVLPGYQSTPQNAPFLARICQRLDGIPLAIELAAARISMLNAKELAARLEDIFRLPAGGGRAALPRHQTLRATIDWSYSLLSQEERLLLQRLSVFAGGCTLEAAEAVCAGEGLEADLVLERLTGLVAKSIVLADRQPGEETRYRMLEMVRQYAGEKLAGEKLGGRETGGIKGTRAPAQAPPGLFPAVRRDPGARALD